MPEVIRPSTVLPANRRLFTLNTSDHLKLIGEVATPIGERVASILCLHPNPTGGGMMDSHIYKKAANRLPHMAGIEVIRFNTRGTASEQGKTMSLSFVNTKIINKTMQAITSFNAVDTSVFIPTVSVNNLNVDIENAIIFPNPSHGGDAYLHLVAKDVLPITVQVTDISGKMIQTLNVQAVKGKNIFTLPTQGISAGVYFVKIISENASLNMKWVKE